MMLERIELSTATWRVLNGNTTVLRTGRTMEHNIAAPREMAWQYETFLMMMPTFP